MLVRCDLNARETNAAALLQVDRSPDRHPFDEVSKPHLE